MRCGSCGTNLGHTRGRCPNRARHPKGDDRCRCAAPVPGVVATRKRTILDGCLACGGRRA